MYIYSCAFLCTKKWNIFRKKCTSVLRLYYLKKQYHFNTPENYILTSYLTKDYTHPLKISQTVFICLLVLKKTQVMLILVMKRIFVRFFFGVYLTRKSVHNNKWFIMTLFCCYCRHYLVQSHLRFEVNGAWRSKGRPFRLQRPKWFRREVWDQRLPFRRNRMAPNIQMQMLKPSIVRIERPTGDNDLFLPLKEEKSIYSPDQISNWKKEFFFGSCRGKSLLESWGTTFLFDWQPPFIFVWFTSKSHEL